MHATISGVTVVDTTNDKTGNHESGDFTLQIETVVDVQNYVRHEENQGRDSTQTTNSTTRHAQTNTGNAKNGNYSVTDGTQRF